ncbi:hypothetical protein CFD26_106248 [Aspergillus turcosus]|uniref:Uncharacterized protein n=1 Tax=Aspergillus turcosus TaxID=1245748 RepID=A0A3R7F8B9_9EURO|nr:hypothetical protein CFD26_106248 [Aspergillus turcosus]
MTSTGCTVDDDPEFDFNFADIPDTEQTDAGPKAKKIQSTKKELQEALNLEDNDDWLEWLRSDLVRPWWEELWNDHLSREQAKERGKGIADIQNRILSGETHGVCKYSSRWPNKEDWDGADHLARFHWGVKDDNLRSREGVFYRKNLSDDQMDRIVWALKGWLCKMHSPSYINRPHGGTAIFGTKRQGNVLQAKSEKAFSRSNLTDN